MEVVPVDGHRLARTRAGAGPAVVLLGGFVGDGLRHLALADRGVVRRVPGGRPGPTRCRWLLGRAGVVPAAGLCRLPGRSAVAAGTRAGGDRWSLVRRRPGIETFHRHRALVRGLFLAGAYAGWSGSLPPDAVAPHGAADVRAPRAVAAALVAAIRPARLVVLDGVGHVSCDEAPGEFTAELRSFLGGL